MLPTNPLLNATAPAGPHLPVALLRQYASGTLAPAAQHRVEAHTLACPRCADILEGLLQTPAATTDQAVAHLQQRLRQRVQQVAPARQGQRLARRPRWVSLQLAAAAALLLSMVAGGWWAWQQRQVPAQEPLATATTTTLQAAEPAAAPPPSYPAAAPATPRVPATAQPAVPLAHLGARHPHRRATPPRAAAQPPATQPAAAATAMATDTAVTQEVATSAAASAPPHRLDSATLGRAARPLTSSRFSVDPTQVQDANMPAAPKIAPMPVGGMASFREKLRREAAEFMPEAPERPLSGTVQLRLTIGADGKLETISVLRGLRADYDAEAQRLVREGPTWVPGVSGGRRATLQVDVAIPF